MIHFYDCGQNSLWTRFGYDVSSTLPAYLARIPASEVTSVGGSASSGAREIDPRDKSGGKVV